MSWDVTRSCVSDAEQCCKCGSVTVQVQDEPRNGCGWGSCLDGHAINCVQLCLKSPTGRLFWGAELRRPVLRDEYGYQLEQIGQRNLPPPANGARAAQGHPTRDQLARLSGYATPNRH